MPLQKPSMHGWMNNSKKESPQAFFFIEEEFLC